MVRKRKRGKNLVGYHDRDTRVAALRAFMGQHPLEGASVVGSGLLGMEIPVQMWLVVKVRDVKDRSHLAAVKAWVGEAAKRLGLSRTPRILLQGSGLNQRSLDSLMGKQMATPRAMQEPSIATPRSTKAQGKRLSPELHSDGSNRQMKCPITFRFEHKGGAFCACCGIYLERYCFARSRNPDKMPRRRKVCAACFATVPEEQRGGWWRYDYASFTRRALGWNPDK